MKKIIIPVIIAVILLFGAAAYWYMDTFGIIGDLYAKAGLYLMNEGKYQGALVNLEKSMNEGTNNDSSIIYGAMGECYNNIGDKDKAIELYKKAIEEDNTSITNMLDLVLVYIAKNDLDSAEELLDKAKAIDSQDQRLRMAFGTLYLQKDEPEKAVAELDAALELAPDPYIYAMEAEAYAMLGDFDKADQYIKQAEQSGLDEKALEYFTAKISEQRDQPSSGGGNGDVSALKGFEMYNDGKYEEAIKTLNDAVEKGTNRYKLSEIYSVIGGCYQELGDYEDAISAHKKALDADSTLVSGYINLSAAYMQNGNLKEAEDCIKMALKIYPEDPVLHFSLGSLYIMKNEPENAIVEFTKAIELDPTLAAAYGSGAIAYAMTGDFERAEELLEQSKVLGYENTEEIQKKIDELRD